MPRSQKNAHHKGLVIDKPASPTLSLEALHLLAQRRAKERKEIETSGKHNSNREVLEKESLKVHSKKRKRQHVIDNSSSTDEDEIYIAQPCKWSPLKASEGRRDLKKTKVKEGHGTLSVSSVTSTGKQKGDLRKLKKLKATSNHESLSVPLVTTPLTSIEDSGDTDSDMASSSESEANAETMVTTSEPPIDHASETQATNDMLNNSVVTGLSDDEPGLEPLTHHQRNSQAHGKPLMQRKLPSWIHHSQIIEEDIKTCSV